MIARRAIVTRPEPQASTWVEGLLARGIDAIALPLITIAPPLDHAPVQVAWAGIAARDLVVFVSPNAVRLFFAHGGSVSAPRAIPWPDHVLAGSTGPGTTAALVGQGVPPACIVEPAADAAQFDSESLWHALEGIATSRAPGWKGSNVLMVRGDGGRDWLADTLRSHGASVDRVAAYRRLDPAATAGESRTLATALAAPRTHAWLFSSAAGIDHLAAIAPGHDWREAFAVASHPRIAERARALGVGQVLEARPGIEAAIACLQSTAP